MEIFQSAQFLAIFKIFTQIRRDNANIFHLQFPPS